MHCAWFLNNSQVQLELWLNFDGYDHVDHNLEKILFMKKNDKV